MVKKLLKKIKIKDTLTWQLNIINKNNFLK